MALTITSIYILLLILIFGMIKDTASRRLSLTYVTYWCISLFLCAINPFRYYTVSNGTYWLLLGHIVAFMTGFVLVKPKVGCNFERMHFHSVVQIVKKKLFLALYFVCMVFILILFYRQRMLLALYTLGELRGDFMSMILEGSGLAYLFYEIVGMGMFHFTLCLLFYMILFERKWFYIAMLFIYDAVWAVVTGGRAQVITMGFYLLSMFIIGDYIQSVKTGYSTRYTLSFRAKIILVLFVVAMGVSMSIVTFMKHSTGTIDKEAFIDGLTELGMDFGEYSAGPIVAFDQGLKDSEVKPKEYQYGAATFCGADYFLYIMLRRFDLHTKSSYYKTTHVFQEALMRISPDRGWNYAYTSCMYYFHDMGVFGVLFIPFLFGFLTRKVVSRLYKSADPYNIAIFSFICFCMYMSVFSGYTQKMMVLFYVLLLLVMSYFTRLHFKVVSKKTA